jgi:hypothetical protein
MSAAPSFHVRRHVNGSHRGYRSDVKPTAVEAASLWLDWSGEPGSVSTAAERLLDGEQLVSEREDEIVVATPQWEYVAIDLDANNRQPAGTFGWGICRRGHGLQDLPKLSERQAVDLAAKLNA